MDSSHPLLVGCLITLTWVAARTSPVAAAILVPSSVDARLEFGHDDNLLDISDVERAEFPGGEAAYFAVNRLTDQFWEGEVEAGWEAIGLPGPRPVVLLGWERRQYFHNPIRSSDRLAFELRLRPGKGARLAFKAAHRPQTYSRHRLDRNSLPGQARFRPEVHRRWDFDVEMRRPIGALTLEGFAEAQLRRYREPFEERDRESCGGGLRAWRMLGRSFELRAGGAYRATWTENEPWDPDDRSHRTWRASAGLRYRNPPFFESIRLDGELEWRRFTSTNPDDRDHFGREDRGGEVALELARRLGKSLEGIGGITWSWRDSDFPIAAFDEEGLFEDTVVHAGVRWAWETTRKSR